MQIKGIEFLQRKLKDLNLLISSTKYRGTSTENADLCATIRTARPPSSELLDDNPITRFQYLSWYRLRSLWVFTVANSKRLFGYVFIHQAGCLLHCRQCNPVKRISSIHYSEADPFLWWIPARRSTLSAWPRCTLALCMSKLLPRTSLPILFLYKK